MLCVCERFSCADPPVVVRVASSQRVSGKHPPAVYTASPSHQQEHLLTAPTLAHSTNTCSQHQHLLTAPTLAHSTNTCSQHQHLLTAPTLTRVRRRSALRHCQTAVSTRRRGPLEDGCGMCMLMGARWGVGEYPLTSMISKRRSSGT
jgi:hypothetical protein